MDNGNCPPRLDNIPKLPKSLKFLYCFDTDITELPELPKGLIILSLDDNLLLQNLPELPDSLLYLQLGDDKVFEIKQLPPNLLLLMLDETKNISCKLPHNLKILQYGGNMEEHCELPDSLISLELSYNCNETSDIDNLHSKLILPHSLEKFSYIKWPINKFTIPLPDSLKYLSIIHCKKLTKLPEKLPPLLDKLICFANDLHELPMLPPNIKKIYCQNNNISALPEELPEGLELLDIRSNNISKLPNSILNTKIIDNITKDNIYFTHKFLCDITPLRPILENYKITVLKKMSHSLWYDNNNNTKLTETVAYDIPKYVKEINAVEKIGVWFLDCKYNPKYKYCKNRLIKEYNELYVK